MTESTPKQSGAGADTSRPLRVCIITVDPSGDAHGASLAEALRRRDERVEVIGAGGPRMREASVELVCDATQWTALGVVGYAAVCVRATIGSHKLRWRLNALRPDILVPIDSARFNIPVTRTLKRWLRVPVLYYVPPRCWWPRWRVNPLKVADYVAAPFPWNVQGDDGTGRVRFVGHPAADLPTQLPAQREARRDLALDPDRLTLAVLPGSRRWEVGVHLPIVVEAVRILRRELPELQVVFARAPTVTAEQLESRLARLHADETHIARGSALALRAADAALVCMGTATLEACVLACPMVTFYKSTRLVAIEALINRPQTAHYAMPNIIAREPVVRELLQREVSPERLAAEARPLLRDSAARCGMVRQLAEVARALGGPGASDRAAQAVFDAVNGEWHLSPCRADAGPPTSAETRASVQ